MLGLCVYGKWAAACLWDLGCTPGLHLSLITTIEVSRPCSFLAIHTRLYMERVPPGQQGLISVIVRTAVGRPAPYSVFRTFLFSQSAVAKLSGTCPSCPLINDNAYKREFYVSKRGGGGITQSICVEHNALPIFHLVIRHELYWYLCLL